MMQENIKRIIIVDDKAEDQKYSSLSLMSRLTSDQIDLVNVIASTKDLWVFDAIKNEIVKLKINFERIDFLFIHQSFDNPVIDEPIKRLMPLIPESAKIVLFSGGGRADLQLIDSEKLYDFTQNPIQMHYEIRRSIWYQNFPNFLNSFLQSGKFRIEALYDASFNVVKEKAVQIFIKLEDYLKSSEYALVNSKEFEDFFLMAGYATNEIDKIKINYLSMDYLEIYESLENELTKF